MCRRRAKLRAAFGPKTFVAAQSEQYSATITVATRIQRCLFNGLAIWAPLYERLNLWNASG